jgi:hypothetical protein
VFIQFSKPYRRKSPQTRWKEGFNPKTQQTVMAQRRRIKVDEELPMKDDYAAFIRKLVARVGEAPAP